MHEADRLPRLLFVDDDEFLLRAVARFLARRYEVVTACGTEAGLATLARDRDFEIVFFDMNMPPTDGPEFLRRARAAWPELCGRYVVMSGDAAAPDVVALAADGACRVMAKPFAADDVAAALKGR